MKCIDCAYHDINSSYVGYDVHYCRKLNIATRNSDYCSFGKFASNIKNSQASDELMQFHVEASEYK